MSHQFLEVTTVFPHSVSHSFIFYSYIQFSVIGTAADSSTHWSRAGYILDSEPVHHRVNYRDNYSHSQFLRWSFSVSIFWTVILHQSRWRKPA